MKKFYSFLFACLIFSGTKSQSLNEIQTKQVFDFLFGKNATSGMIINESDKVKAYFFLDQLVQGSCKMSVANALLTSALPVKTSISGAVADIVKAIIKSAYQNCYVGVQEGNFYESIRSTLALKWKSAFAIRKQTGEWI